LGSAVKVTCTKKEAAVRQIDVAIGLLFTDGDPLAIRTLAGAAQGILADLVENQNGGSSWRTRLIENSGLKKNVAIQVLQGAQNFLKHANRDPDSDLSFEEEENDHVLFVASLECCELSHQLSLSMQAFQIWYLALYSESIGHDSEQVLTSRKVFPGLASKPRCEQLLLGHAFLEQVMNDKGLLSDGAR